ncbi:MAG: hypothetical protein HZB17_14725 [Chloroflexi bacterium]|nr:hypothetical protein [Chloroflexota bacterium]
MFLNHKKIAVLVSGVLLIALLACNFTNISSPQQEATPQATNAKFEARTVKLLDADTKQIYVGSNISVMVPAWKIDSSTDHSIFLESPDKETSFSMILEKFDAPITFEQYSSRTIGGFLQKYPALKVIDNQKYKAATGDGILLDGQRIQYTGPNGLSGALHVGSQENFGFRIDLIRSAKSTESLKDLMRYMDLAVQTFFLPAPNSKSVYAPYDTIYSQFDFQLAYPNDSTNKFFGRITGDFTQPPEAYNGMIQLGASPNWQSIHTDFGWFSPDDSSATGLAKIHLSLLQNYKDIKIITQGDLIMQGATGRYVIYISPNGEGINGIWQCTDSRRGYFLDVQNNPKANNKETLFLFQRYLIGFACSKK